MAYEGYYSPMGNQPRNGEPAKRMTTARAVSDVLTELSEGRRLNRISEATGIPYPRLRHLRDGQQSVDADDLLRLRSYPGFSPKFDEIMGIDDPDADAANLGLRLRRAFQGGGVEEVVYALETLALHADADTISDLLRVQSKALSRKKKTAEPVSEPAKIDSLRSKKA